MKDQGESHQPACQSHRLSISSPLNTGRFVAICVSMLATASQHLLLSVCGIWGLVVTLRLPGTAPHHENLRRIMAATLCLIPNTVCMPLLVNSR